MYRELDQKEKQEFRQWARDNYKEGDPIKEIWHPVVKKECYKMNREFKTNKKEENG